MLRVGLTGGIASGKSHVAACLARAGFRILDLDRVGHEVIAPNGPAYAEVVSAFGPRILAKDGAIDRKALGAIVFADAAARGRLNAMVHPRIRAEEERLLSALGDEPGAVLIVEAALMVETGQHLRFDRLVVAHCAPDEQRRRLKERNGLDEASAAARLLAQMPAEEKRHFAHFEVDTSGSIAETEGATERLAGVLRGLALRPRARVEMSLERAAGLVLGGPGEGPRGLSPLRLLRETAEAGSLEMERLAGLLSPPATGPWYCCARPAEEPGAQLLVGPVVLWALVRAGDDPAFIAAAAASLARLVHGEASRRTRTVLSALALHEAIARGGPLMVSSRARVLAERWGGAATDAGWLEQDREQTARLLAPRAPDVEARALLTRILASRHP